MSSILSKIASQDIPLEFKELIPTLIGYSIGSYEPIDPCIAVETRFNTANALEFILADLCTKRLLMFKKYIVSIASTHLSDIATNGLEYLTKADSGHLEIILKYATIMTKILNHLILSSLSSLVDNKGSNSDDKMSDVESSATNAIYNVFKLLLEQIPLLRKHLQEVNDHQSDGLDTDQHNQINGDITTLLGEFYALVVAAQRAHPIAFARFLYPFLTLFYTEIDTMASTKKVEPLFAIPQMMFLANVISCSHYDPDETSNESMETWRSEVMTDENTRRVISTHGDICIDPNSVNSAIKSVWSQFLTSERIQNLVDLSLFFMSLNDTHIADWSDDPESFYVERKNAVSEDDIISCAQNLYLSLLESKCRASVVQKLFSHLCRVEDQVRAAYAESGHSTCTENYAVITFWDSVYTAAGLSFDALKSCGVDINDWFVSSLSQVMQIILEPRQHQVCSNYHLFFIIVSSDIFSHCYIL